MTTATIPDLITRRTARPRGRIARELIVDNFAGAGGASVGIEAALGRAVDIAINHDAVAMEIHQINHPETDHLVTDVWDVDPMEATGGQYRQQRVPGSRRGPGAGEYRDRPMNLRDAGQLALVLSVAAVVWIAAVLVLAGCGDPCRTHRDYYYWVHQGDGP